MKKILALVMVLAMVLALAACGSAKPAGLFGSLFGTKPVQAEQDSSANGMALLQSLLAMKQ